MAWFRRNKKASTAEPSVETATADDVAEEDRGAVTGDAEASALIQRWDAAIAEIRLSFDAVLAEASAGSEPLIEAVESDLTPLTRPWNTIEARRHKLGEQIADTWDDLSDEMSECDGFTHEMMSQEGSKRDAATLELEIVHLEVYGAVMARASERMRHRALAVDAAEHECQRCGARLDKVRPVSEALNVECGYCDAMNTVDPGTAMRMFAAMGAHHLAEQAAMPDRAAMMRAEHRMNQYRDNKDVPMALLEEFEAAARRYHTRRLTCEAEHNPELQKHVDMKLARYMKDAERTLKQYWQWRQRAVE